MPLQLKKPQVNLTVEEDTETQAGTTKDLSHPKVTMATSLNTIQLSEVLTVLNQDKLKETHQSSLIAIISSRETTGNGDLELPTTSIRLELDSIDQMMDGHALSSDGPQLVSSCPPNALCGSSISLLVH